MWRFISLVVLLMLPIWLSAQKVRTASGSYTYFVPSNVPTEKAELIAFERLRTQIIADNFGRLVSSSNFTNISNSTQGSVVNVMTIGESEVKGEWLETVGVPKYTYGMDEHGGLIITVQATGRIREITTPPIEFDAKLLRNGTTEEYEAYDFKENDKLYLSFKSPVAGYVAIFLYDGNSEVYRMLPYSNQADESIPIVGNKEYIFFSLKNAGDIADELIDEYILSCSKRVEYNRVYIIFSTQKIIKPMDTSATNSDSPRVLTFEAFQKWLTKCRKLDSGMRVDIKDISIAKKD